MVKNNYKYGFETEVELEKFPLGINEEIVKLISKKKNEPKWLLDFRLKSFEIWKKMKKPKWQKLKIPKINFQEIYYYAAPKNKEGLKEIDKEIKKTFEKLGIPLEEQKRLKGVAVDAIFDSVSVSTTYQKKLEKVGVVFCSISEAVQKYPELVKKYLGSVVPKTDNYYATLNSAVFTDGSFVYLPKGVKCPMDLTTYFRINAKDSGQFERTLIIAEEGSYVNYLEGCTAPIRDTNQLHAAVVELIAEKDAEIRYSTVQNWYSGDSEGKGGIFNFVTKRGLCRGENSKISWTQVEAGSAVTWKYPSCILKGDNSQGSFYSVAVTNNHMQADTGSKMTHIGKNTKSTIISKGISSDYSSNTYRGEVKILKGSTGSKNYTQCDSMLIGDNCSATTYPYIELRNNSSIIEHEATTSKINEEKIFYLGSRGLSSQKAASMIVNGFCKEVFKQLPLEFSAEAVKLIEMKLENPIG